MKAVNNLRWALMTFAMIVIIDINAQTTDIHIVKRGETFASIAKNYGTTEAELRKANPNVKSCLVGLKLKIASPVPSKKSTPKDSKITARQVKQQIQKTSYADKQNVHVFEGMLLYRNYEHHNAIVRKFSAGQAYNGERTVKVTLRDNSVHIVDEDMHIHTIVIPEEDKVYMYSDVSKKGFVANGNELKKFFTGNDPDITPYPDMEKSSSLKTTGIQKYYKGDQCQVYAGQITVNDNLLTDVEMWYSDRLLANKSYCQLFNGLPVPGIVRKGIISQTGKLPLLGSLRSTVAYELVALTECKMSDAEFTPPQDITIEPYTKDTQLHSFYKNSSKALKKAKLYPEQVKTKEIDYKIGQEWDFADEWLTKKYGSVDNNLTWGKLGDSLFRTASSISDLIGLKTENVTNSSEARKSSGISSSSDYSSGDMPDAESLDMSLNVENMDPDLRQRWNSLVAKQRELYRQIDRNLNRQRPYILTANLKAASAEKLGELKSEYKELRREQKEVEADLKFLKREARDRRMARDREQAQRTAEAREAQHQTEQEHIDRDYERDKEKTEREKQELFKLGYGERYLKQYAFHKDIVYGIKIRSASYANYSIDEKRKAVRKSQREMKEYREKYRKGAGTDIPGASNSLENWEPTDYELRQ